MKEGWTYKKFKEISYSISDGDWIESKDQSCSGIRLIQTGNIGVGKFIPKDDSRKYITEDTFKRLRCNEIFEGDVLISRLPNPLGRSCILPKLDTRCITAVDCSIVRIKKDVIIPDYFIYYTQSQGYFSKIDSESSGTTRARITRKKLEQTEIPLPPLSEQQSIVKYLDSAFAKIDAMKANAAKALNEAKALFQASLKEMLEPKEGWEEKKLSDVVISITDGDHQPPPKSKDGIPFITISNIDKKSNKIIFEDTFYVPQSYFSSLKGDRIPQNGDVLYTVTGSFGIPVLIDFQKNFCFQRHIALIRPNLEQLSSTYLFYWILSCYAISQAEDTATGAAQRTVSLNSLRSFTIGVPSLYEQQVIVDILDSLKSKVDRLQENFDKISQECDALKQAILRQVFE